MAGLGAADIFLVLLSLLAVFGVAAYESIRRKNAAAASSTTTAAQQFFLAGRSMPASIIAASLFASNIGWFVTSDIYAADLDIMCVLIVCLCGVSGFWEGE